MITPFIKRPTPVEFQAMPDASDLSLNFPAFSGVRQTLFGQNEQSTDVLLISEDAAARVLLRSLLNLERCHVVEAASGAAAMELLTGFRPGLVVLDRDLTGMDALKCCEMIKAGRSTQLTPVLMVTSIQSSDDQIAGIRAGADDYLSKPLHHELFRARVRALMRHKSLTDRLEESETILFALAQAIEKRDQCTAGHCQRLALFSVAFGIRLGLPQSDLLALHRGGYLHDIGKIAIPDAILFKPGRLTAEEWILMKTHSLKGEEICRPLHSLKPVLPIIRSHHERWDGGGYPDGLRGSKIPLLASVLQLADAYDALTTARPYKPAYSIEASLEIIRGEGKLGWRDPLLTSLFVAMPFEKLHAASERAADVAGIGDFAESLRNLQQHLRIAS